MPILKSKKETIEFGQKLAKKLKGGDVLCLYGELGAGKTTLVKGIARGLGIKKIITSPTFTLMNMYNLPTTVSRLRPKHSGAVSRSQSAVVRSLVHIDTYRLKHEDELLEIGAEDYVGAPDTITIIEWPEKLKKTLKNKKTIKIVLKHAEKGRQIKITKSKL